jgi:hypothetical protein
MEISLVPEVEKKIRTAAVYVRAIISDRGAILNYRQELTCYFSSL